MTKQGVKIFGQVVKSILNPNTTTKILIDQKGDVKTKDEKN